MREQYVGAPPDVVLALKRIGAALNELTVLDQQSVIEMLVVRHVFRRAYPDEEKLLEVLSEVLSTIVQTSKLSLQETRAHERKNKG